MKLTKFFLYFIIIIIIIITMTIIIFRDDLNKESQQRKQERLNTMCYLGFKSISKAIIEYSEKEGNKLYLPPTLDTLVHNNYLKSQDVFHCGCQFKKKYYYIKNLRLDMPGNIPIFLEKDASHSLIYNGKKIDNLGFVAYLDFSIKYMYKSDIDFLIQNTQEALKISQTNDIKLLFQKLTSNNYNKQMQTLILWKLGQLNLKLVDKFRLKNYLQSDDFWVTLEAAITLFKNGDQSGLGSLLISLSHENYFTRKKIFSNLLGNKNKNVDFISQNDSKKIAKKVAKKYFQNRSK